MKILLFLAACFGGIVAAGAADAKKPLTDRIKEFTAVYDTGEKITKRLAEWSAAEPHSPEPYIMAANAYLKIADRVTIGAGQDRPGFADIVDPKTGRKVGSISEGPDSESVKLALAALVT